jgi:hypothetical protein
MSLSTGKEILNEIKTFDLAVTNALSNLNKKCKQIITNTSQQVFVKSLQIKSNNELMILNKRNIKDGLFLVRETLDGEEDYYSGSSIEIHFDTKKVIVNEHGGSCKEGSYIHELNYDENFKYCMIHTAQILSCCRAGDTRSINGTNFGNLIDILFGGAGITKYKFINLITTLFDKYEKNKQYFENEIKN